MSEQGNPESEAMWTELYNRDFDAMVDFNANYVKPRYPFEVHVEAFVEIGREIGQTDAEIAEGFEHTVAEFDALENGRESGFIEGMRFRAQELRRGETT